MQPAVAIFGSLHTLYDFGRLMELSLFDRDVDSNDILPDDTPCTDVQMPSIVINASVYCS